jgi:hypothetical protein
MKKTLCYSVRLKSLTSISEKAYKATCFDGTSDILPKSCVLATDHEVQKSEAYWIAAWILEKKNLQYSDKKRAWYNPKSGKLEPAIRIIVETHVPAKIEVVKTEPNHQLRRQKP